MEKETGLTPPSDGARPAIIYALCCPLEQGVRYVGKTIDLEFRVKRHVFDARRGKLKYHHGRWLRRLLKHDLRPVPIVLYRVPADARWQDAERFFIATASYLGFELTNSTPGGEGVDLSNAVAREHWEAARSTPEYKARHSASLKATYSRPEVLSALSAQTTNNWRDPEKRK